MKTRLPVTELIRRDHREMERHFDELADIEKRVLVAPALLALLGAHSRAEEAEVYPVLRSDTRIVEVVAHSQEEHAEADVLVSELVQGDLDDSAYDRTLERLVAAVSHHIEEEEEKVLPALEQLPAEHQLELGSNFARERADILCAGVDSLSRVQLERQARNEGIANARQLNVAELSRAVTPK